MPCQLPVPLWTSQQVGLISAIENVVDGYITIDIASAQPVAPATQNYYTLYYSLNIDDLFTAPKLITLENRVSVPPTLLTTDHYIAVRTAQRGISGDISYPNLNRATSDLFVYPSQTTLTSSLSPNDGYIVIEDATGYPRQDGYVKIEDEIIHYSDVVDGYDGYDGLLILDRDPFGCNDIMSYADGYSLELFKGFEDVNTTRFKALGSCALTKPTWPDGIGIKRVEDLGIGTSVRLEWNDASIPAGFSDLYFNIYRTDNLTDMLKFGTLPIAFSTATTGIIPDLNPGKSNYFAVKASYQLQNLQLSGFDLLSPNVYAYPAVTTVQQGDGYWNEDETGTLTVSSTEGYPLSGFLQIRSEVMQYSSITSTTFNIIERDVFTMDLVEDYPNGTPLAFFRGVQDTNRNYYRTVPSWDAARDVPWMPLPDGYNGIPADGYNGAAYGQDADGYRAAIDDILNEDLSDFEDDKTDDDLLDRCTYHRENWDNLFSRNQCGTYSGGQRTMVIPGVNNGNPVAVGGGIDVWEHATKTEEDLLSKTGDYFVLLRRKWEGRKCPRLSIRSEHPHARCGTCYGTTFQGGYDRYPNPRLVHQGQTNPNGFIMVRVDPYDDEIRLNDRGLEEDVTISGWTISIPQLKKRDILIRYIYDRSSGLFVESFRYEILKVNRNRLLFNENGKQTLSLRRLDPTREIYKFSDMLLDGTGTLPGTPIPPGA